MLPFGPIGTRVDTVTTFFGVGQVLRSLLVQTGPTDPLTLASITLLLVAVGIAACLLPARQATRLNPVAALRHE